jgi:hypothetical protein
MTPDFLSNVPWALFNASIVYSAEPMFAGD